MKRLAPGATIGIVGAGQLGRMTAQAAHALGFRTLVLSDHDDAPATQVSPHVLAPGFAPGPAIEVFARHVDRVTFEFENIPAATLAAIEEHVPVVPNVDCLRITQDREQEKRFIESAGIRVAPWRLIASDDDVQRAMDEARYPAILKTCTLGYDGRGQRTVDAPDMLEAAWSSLGRTRCVLEHRISFSCEISVIVARSTTGEVRAFPPSRNEHRDHILHRSILPSGLLPETEARAVECASELAEALDLMGLLTVEFFVVDDRDLIVNELAPRPHNSGHWTLDACVTSQFEQLVRAVAGLPLGDTSRLAPCEMTNLIGDEVEQRDGLLALPGRCVHLYGKREVRPGRKMGHVTRLLLGGT
jgi:5-(carboxyamino)imidazole ribonucleotide synthase